nr:MAG: ORF1 [TTV-like mini virus]UGV35390.1 MAG: ORF1 [TTV-like mini virus]
MPYWRTYRRYRYRPRWRRYRRRITRRPFQRRLWRRRRYRVRKRKLKSLKIRQWQPQFIRKLKVVGIHPLVLTTSERTTNNLTCYLESTAPHLMPGGGGFSINNFTLNTLYEQHLVLQNWWTVTNDNMPLIRYCGCTLYLYRQAENDYLFQYNRTYPMTASLLTYTSTHPSAMLLHKNTRKIICKKNNRNRKPYKKLKIPPPAQMFNKWYFQRDIAHVPLLQTMCTAASLDRMFLHSKAVSSTIGFTSLDILGFRNHYYSKTGTQGYTALPGSILFGVHRSQYNIKNIDITELIYMGNPENLTEGIPIGNITQQEYQNQTGATNTIGKQIKAMQLNSKFWGNPFNDQFHREGALITTNKTWQDIIQKYDKQNKGTDTKLDDTWFTFKTNYTIDCRYNPFADKGAGNKLYLINIKDQAHDIDWDYPIAQTLYTDLPLWLMFWGYLDFQRKCGEQSQIDTNSLIVFKTKYVFPKDKTIFVPLDQDFLEGRSPYAEPQHVVPSDLVNWHPKTRFQVRTANAIGSCGPGVIKLPENISAEVHMKYVFHFKIGGQPPPMATLTDPDAQPKYITPDNIIQQTSLQSPTTPFEYLLYNFDERRGTITKAAIKRMQKHQETEQSLFPIAETAFACPIASKKETPTSESSEEEKEEMSITEQLKHQRKQQRLLRKRIQQLLHRLTALE